MLKITGCWFWWILAQSFVSSSFMLATLNESGIFCIFFLLLLNLNWFENVGTNVTSVQNPVSNLVKWFVFGRILSCVQLSKHIALTDAVLAYNHVKIDSSESQNLLFENETCEMKVRLWSDFLPLSNPLSLIENRWGFWSIVRADQASKRFLCLIVAFRQSRGLFGNLSWLIGSDQCLL